ncbi:geranylgeranyl transferase type-1 subunit beta [Diutina catenulata]
MELARDKHVKYFRRCLAAFPAQVQSEDANCLALVYFCLHGLSLAGGDELPARERGEIAQHIYQNFVVETDKWQAFRPTSHFRNTDATYDPVGIAATFFGLASLLQLEWSEYASKINTAKVMTFLERCRDPETNGYAPALLQGHIRFGEQDLRQAYMAAGVASMVGSTLPSTVHSYILDRVCFNGGLASTPGAEPHLGFTFCGIACLKLSQYNLGDHNWSHTVDWLAHRHVEHGAGETPDDDRRGSYNGRDNKLGDTCYSWWCTGSLALLGRHEVVNVPVATEFLLQNAQNTFIGGFSKDGQAMPDPLHSYLALAALSLMGYPGFEPVDTALVMTQQSVAFLRMLYE